MITEEKELGNHLVESSLWPSPRNAYRVGHFFMAIAGLSAITMVILNAAWEANPYDLPEESVAFLTLASAVYAIGAGVHYATRGDTRKFLANTFHLIAAGLFFATATYLLDSNGLLAGEFASVPESSTQKVFASLYAVMGMSSMIASTAHLCNVANPKA